MPTRSRIYIDLTAYRTMDGRGYTRFLQYDAAREVRYALLTATATAPEGTEVVVNVGNLIPCGELDTTQWRDLDRRLRLVIQADDAETAQRWEAAARGQSDVAL